MSKFNEMNPKALEALMTVAAKKLNTSPEVLKKQLSEGTYDKALAGMPQKDANMLVQALSNPRTAEKILSSPQAQAIFKKLR